MKLPSLVHCFKLLVLLALARLTMHVPDEDVLSSLGVLRLDGHFSFHDVSAVARDFGNQCSFLPAAVLHPGSVSDIATTVRHVFSLGEGSPLTVAARGHGHSLMGQSQAAQGIVVRMESLQGARLQVHGGVSPFVDAPGGELWINVLRETLKHGLAPKSWTDYLHLTVGGTLSNAGVSGQAFRHGPQEEEMSLPAHPRITLISSMVLLAVLVSLGSSPEQGLHLSSDFESFTEDQEMLIMAENSFDYIEGFVIINRTGILNNWRVSFKPQDPVQASHFQSDGRVLYCLELTKNFNSDDADIMEQEVTVLLSRLRFIQSTLFHTDVTYLEFLDRVHTSELKLRAQGLWEVPHPWLNLLVPRSSIRRFAKEVFGKILKDSNNGPILLYPVNKSKWDNRTSVVIPDEEIFYLVGLLSSAPSLSGHGSIAHAMNLNNQIVEFCEEADIGMKQYLAPYTTQQQWKAHFGARWETFERRKHRYDPLAILAPGQRIFPKASLPLSL